jgi:hypothetical protein
LTNSISVSQKCLPRLINLDRAVTRTVLSLNIAYNQHDDANDYDVIVVNGRAESMKAMSSAGGTRGGPSRNICVGE